MSIQLESVDVFFGKQQVLYDLSLTCALGEILVLLGPSGAGKSSLLRVLNLLNLPRAGTLSIAQRQFDFNHPPSEQAKRELRQNVGMIFQSYNLWPHLTVLDNLTQAPRSVLGLNADEAHQRAVTLLERLQLTPFSKRYPSHLSGGQQQRVAIARALMMQPQVLLFDEPTAALDPAITSQVVDIIQELRQTKITQVIVTHDVDFARKTASRIAYMEAGKILEQGDVTHFNHPQTGAFAHYLSH